MKYVTAIDPDLLRPSIIGMVRVVSIGFSRAFVKCAAEPLMSGIVPFVVFSLGVRFRESVEFFASLFLVMALVGRDVYQSMADKFDTSSLLTQPHSITSTRVGRVLTTIPLFKVKCKSQGINEVKLSTYQNLCEKCCLISCSRSKMMQC